MENLYQVWLKARHPKTLQPVASLLVFSHEDRLRAEGIVEAAQQSNAFRDVADVFRIWHPGCLIDVEMAHPVGVFSVPRKASVDSVRGWPKEGLPDELKKNSDECRMDGGLSNAQARMVEGINACAAELAQQMRKAGVL